MAGVGGAAAPSARSRNEALHRAESFMAQLEALFPLEPELDAPKEPELRDVIQAVQHAGLCVPVLLHASTDGADSTYPIREQEVVETILAPDFLEDPFYRDACVFRTGFFVPITHLDLSVPYWKFDLGKPELREHIDNTRTLYTLFVYTLAMMTRASESACENRRSVDVFIEPIAAPGYSARDFERVGHEALLGYMIHGFVQLGPSDKKPDTSELEAAIAEAELYASTLNDRVRTRLEQERDRLADAAMQAAPAPAPAPAPAAAPEPAPAPEEVPAMPGLEQDDDLNSQQLFEEAMSQESYDAHDAYADAHAGLFDGHEVDQANQQQEQKERENHARDMAALQRQEMSLLRGDLRAAQDKVRTLKREYKAAMMQYNIKKKRLDRFFAGSLWTKIKYHQIPEYIEAMMQHYHNYAADTCMSTALHLLSGRLATRQHQFVLDLLAPDLDKFRNSKLFRDLLAQAQQHTRTGVLVHMPSFLCAVQWYNMESPNRDLLPHNIPNAKEAQDALANPQMGADMFERSDRLQGLRFCNIFQPERAYAMARREYERVRANRITLRPWTFVYTGPLDFHGALYHVAAQDVTFPPNPFVSVPPLTCFYHLHAVMKHLRPSLLPRGDSDAAGGLRALDALDDLRDMRVDSDNSRSMAGSRAGPRRRFASLRLYMGIEACHAALALFYELESRIRERIRMCVAPDGSEFAYAEQYRRRRHALDYFSGIWSKSADLPPALHAVIDYLNDRIVETGGQVYHFRLRHMSPELTPFAHYMMYLFAGFDMLMGAHTTHRVLCLMLMATRHVYSDNPEAFLHPHILFRGGHGTGKSHAASIIQKLLIKGTYVCADHTSAQAMSFEGDDTNKMVMFQEEATIVRADHGSRVSQDGLQASSAAANNAKNSLSERVVHVLRVEQDDTKKLRRKQTTVNNDNVLLATTNTPEAASVAAILDRMSQIQFISRADVTRFGRFTAADSDPMPADPAQRAEWQARRKEYGDFLRLMQALVCRVMMMQGKDGVLLPFVDMTAVAQFRTLLCNVDNPLLIVSNARAERDEMNKANRVFKRLNAICEVLTIERALVLTFFCPGSPFRPDHVWCDDDVLAIAPHLAVTTEVLYAALGLLFHEFIDEQAVLVLRALSRWMSQSATASTQYKNEPRHPRHCYYYVQDIAEVRDKEKKFNVEPEAGGSASNPAADAASSEAPASASASAAASSNGEAKQQISAWEPAAFRAFRAAGGHTNAMHTLVDDSQAAIPRQRSGNSNTHLSAAAPQQQHFSHQDHHEHKNITEAAREQQSKMSMSAHVESILLDIVKSDPSVLMNDMDIRAALKRVRKLRIPKSWPQCTRSKQRTRPLFDVILTGTQASIYMHSNVYYLKDAATTFFGIVDDVLAKRIGVPQVMVTGVSIPFQPAHVQRRLVVPERGAAATSAAARDANEVKVDDVIDNPQFLDQSLTHAFGMDVTATNQALFVESSNDLDTTAVTHCLGNLGAVARDAKMDLASVERALQSVHPVRVVPYHPVRQTMQLFDLSPAHLRYDHGCTDYYWQALTLAQYTEAHHKTKNKLLKNPRWQRASRCAQAIAFRQKFIDHVKELIGTPDPLDPGEPTLLAKAVEPLINHRQRVVTEIRAMLARDLGASASASASASVAAAGAAASIVPASSTSSFSDSSNEARRRKRHRARMLARSQHQNGHADDEDEDEEDDDYDYDGMFGDRDDMIMRYGSAAAARTSPASASAADAGTSASISRRVHKRRLIDSDDEGVEGGDDVSMRSSLPDAAESDLFGSLAPP